MGPEGWTVVATSHSTRDDGHLINCFAVDAATEAVSNAERKGVCSSLRVHDDDEEEGDGDCWPTPLNTTAAATTPKRLDSFAKTPQFARRYVADWPAVSEWRVLSDSETSTTTSSCSSCFKQPCADKGIQRVGTFCTIMLDCVGSTAVYVIIRSDMRTLTGCPHHAIFYTLTIVKACVRK